MKKLLCVFTILTIIASIIQIPALANNGQATYFDGETLMLENFHSRCFCNKITTYEKNGLIEGVSYFYEGDDAFSYSDGSYRSFLNYLESQGWVETTNHGYDSEGYQGMKSNTLVKGDFKISVNIVMNNMTPINATLGFYNTAVVAMPGESTSKTVKPFGAGLNHTVENGILTISGSGQMIDFDFKKTSDIPWHGEKITKLIIGENVKNIGRKAFNDLNELTTVEIKNPAIIIESNSFTNCNNIKEIFFAGTQEQWDELQYNITATVVYLGDGSKWLSAEEKEKLELEAWVTENQIKMTIGSKDAVAFGKKLTMDVEPQIINGRTMLPARYVTEYLGGEIEWLAEHQIVAVTTGPLALLFKIGSPKVAYLIFEGEDSALSTSFPDSFDEIAAEINENDVLDIAIDYVGYKAEKDESYSERYFSFEGYKLDSEPVIIEGRTFMPVRFIANFLGAEVMWDGSTQTVTLQKSERPVWEFEEYLDEEYFEDEYFDEEFLEEEY